MATRPSPPGRCPGARQSANSPIRHPQGHDHRPSLWPAPRGRAQAHARSGPRPGDGHRPSPPGRRAEARQSTPPSAPQERGHKPPPSPHTPTDTRPQAQSPRNPARPRRHGHRPAPDPHPIGGEGPGPTPEARLQPNSPRTGRPRRRDHRSTAQYSPTRPQANSPGGAAPDPSTTRRSWRRPQTDRPCQAPVWRRRSGRQAPTPPPRAAVATPSTPRTSRRHELPARPAPQA